MHQKLMTRPEVAGIVLGVALLLAFIGWFRGRKRWEHPKFKPLLTQRERAMFARLVDAFPNHAILAQISFGALLTARWRGTRNRFDRKIADFAICDRRTAKVLVLIELDDSSHRGKEAQDAARDKMLRRAGYVVRRYPNIPRVSTLQSDLKKFL